MKVISSLHYNMMLFKYQTPFAKFSFEHSIFESYLTFRSTQNRAFTDVTKQAQILAPGRVPAPPASGGLSLKFILLATLQLLGQHCFPQRMSESKLSPSQTSVGQPHAWHLSCNYVTSCSMTST
jgi:hypothetical protein